jgi:hypothetical protein
MDMLTAGVNGELTIIVIILLFAVVGLAQAASLVIIQVTASLLLNVALV